MRSRQPALNIIPMLKKNIMLIILLFGLTLAAIAPAYGQGILPPATGPIPAGTVAGQPDCQAPAGSSLSAASYCGDYSVNDFLSLAINISKWILGIVGSLSLIMFIYGGFMFLISGGSADAVGHAKKILVAAVIGLIIVFASYLIIKFALGALGLNWNGGATVSQATTAAADFARS